MEEQVKNPTKEEIAVMMADLSIEVKDRADKISQLNFEINMLHEANDDAIDILEELREQYGEMRKIEE